MGNICLAFGPWLVHRSDVSPEAAAFWRLLIAVPLLALAVRISRGALPRIDRRLGIALALGGMFFALNLTFWHIGLLHTRFANASLFANVASFTFPAYGYLLARRWPHPRSAFALLLAAAGLILLAGRSYELSPADLKGDMLCVLGGLCYTGYLAALDGVRGSHAPLPLMLLLCMATVPFIGVIAGLAPPPFWPRDWTPLILLAICSQVLGQGAMLYALGRLPPVVVGLALMIQPIGNAAIGWIVYGQRLGLADLLGAMLIGAALVLVRRGD